MLSLITPEFLLRFGVSLIMLVFGIHQLIKPQDWFEYIPKWLQDFLPTKPTTEMRMHALGNILFGGFLLSNIYPVAAGWVAFIWWLTILPFAFRRSWAIGMRDLTIIFALGAYILLVT